MPPHASLSLTLDRKRLRKAQSIESPFPQGAHTFSDIYHPNAFFSDKTGFIRKLESDPTARAVLLLFPRQFGKTVLLDTLAQYYDLRNKKRFNELFESTDIGRDPTPLRSRYMVLSLDFGALNTSSYEAFNISLNTLLATEIESFCTKYRVPVPSGRDGIDIFHALGESLESPVRVCLFVSSFFFSFFRTFFPPPPPPPSFLHSVTCSYP